MPGRRRTGSRPSSTSISRAVYSASALDAREATLSGARPFGSGAPNKSFVALVLAGDFNGLVMYFHVLRADGAGESASLTMPWIGLKSDGARQGGRRRSPRGQGRLATI